MGRSGIRDGDEVSVDCELFLLVEVLWLASSGTWTPGHIHAAWPGPRASFLRGVNRHTVDSPRQTGPVLDSDGKQIGLMGVAGGG